MKTPAHEALGLRVRHIVDEMSGLRGEEFADVMVAEIGGEDFPRRQLVGWVAFGAGLDFFDGVGARFGSVASDTPLTSENSMTDGNADQNLHHKTLDALIARAKAKNQPRYAASLRKSQETAENRDGRMNEFRPKIAALSDSLSDDVDISASAVLAGKLKTWMNSFALGVAVSPLASRKSGRLLAAGLYKAGERLALKSERDVKQKVAKQIGDMGLWGYAANAGLSWGDFNGHVVQPNRAAQNTGL